MVRYEYTPGFDKLDASRRRRSGPVTGSTTTCELGLTANANEGDADSNLGAADLTLRKSADSWFKVQTGRSKGLLSSSLQSDDGGFGFQWP